VSEGRKTQREVRTQFGGTRSGVQGQVTIGLIVVNCAMLLASVLSAKSPANAVGGRGSGFDLLLGGSTPLLNRLEVVGTVDYGVPGNYVHYRTGIADGEYYRLFTAMFMHIGFLHLAVNMWTLWVIGRPLEAMFGRWRFLAIYLVCGLGGNVAVYAIPPGQPSAGASTAIFGLFGVFVFVLRRMNRSLNAIIPTIILNLILTFSIPQISKWGHVGGLVTGLIVGYGVTHIPQQRRTQIQAAVLAGTFMALALITFWQTQRLHPLPDLPSSVWVGS